MPQMADTLDYLYLGLGVSFGILGLYVLSVLARLRSAHKDIATLESLREE